MLHEMNSEHASTASFLRTALRRFSTLMFALTVVLGVAASAPSTARADDDAQAAAVEEARHRMERGQQLFAEEKFSEAMAEFEAAYKVQPYKAFLYNAAVAAERAGDRERAVARYKEFLAAEPNAPDAGQIKGTIDRLEKEDRAAPPTAATEVRADIRSVVIILSEPKGAPAAIWERIIATAPVFDPAKVEQPGWRRVAGSLVTPIDIPLKVGTYHLVVDAYRDFNRSDTELTLQAGTVFIYKAGLSQGAIVGKLQINTPVAGAKVYVDDPLHKNAPIGNAPGMFDVAPGKHKLSIEAPGYRTFDVEVTIEQGKIKPMQIDLQRDMSGYLTISSDADEMKIKIDGVGRGTQAATEGPYRIKLDQGTHDVFVDAKGRHAYKAKLEVLGGRDLPVRVNLSETGGKGGAIGTTILSAASVGAGAALFGLSGSSDFEANEKKNLKYAGIGCFIGAGVFAGLSAFLFVYDPSDPSTAKVGPARDLQLDGTPAGPSKPGAAPKKTSGLRRLEIAPVVGGQTNGLFVTGRF